MRDVFLCLVTFQCCVLGQVWYLIVSIYDLCLLFCVVVICVLYFFPHGAVGWSVVYDGGISGTLLVSFLKGKIKFE